MKELKKIRRFYQNVSYEQEGRSWVIMLDEKTLTSPARTSLRLPSEALAQLLVTEWDAQIETINPEAMPHTKLANVAHDHMGATKSLTVGELVRFASNDVLCFRVAQPLDLQERQAQQWDVWLDWAEQRFGARLGTSTGLQSPQIPLIALETMRSTALEMEPFLLTAMTHAASILSSTVLGFALAEGKLDAKTAFDLSRIEENWQIERWGVDEEAAERAEYLLASLQASTKFMLAAQS